MSTDSVTTSSRPQNRRADIEKWFALREREGLTWKQLSARSGIPLATLTSWQQKLRKEAEGNAPPRRFVEVTPPPAAPAAGLTLEAAHGLRVHVPTGFEADTLKRLLSALGVPC